MAKAESYEYLKMPKLSLKLTSMTRLAVVMQATSSDNLAASAKKTKLYNKFRDGTAVSSAL